MQTNTVPFELHAKLSGCYCTPHAADRPSPPHPGHSRSQAGTPRQRQVHNQTPTRHRHPKLKQQMHRCPLPLHLKTTYLGTPACNKCSYRGYATDGGWAAVASCKTAAVHTASGGPARCSRTCDAHSSGPGVLTAASTTASERSMPPPCHHCTCLPTSLGHRRLAMPSCTKAGDVGVASAASTRCWVAVSSVRPWRCCRVPG
jgi:hypothetical protein